MLYIQAFTNLYEIQNNLRHDEQFIEISYIFKTENN
jgi:hypothetical protein